MNDLGGGDAVERERRLLQIAIALAGIVPVAAGLAGIVLGPDLTGDRLSLSGASHYRYLSGLLFGIGLAFWSTIPAVEAKGARMRLLAAIVVAGGLARLLGLSAGMPSGPMLAALAMELVVTPAIALWQARLARQHREPPLRSLQASSKA